MEVGARGRHADAGAAVRDGPDARRGRAGGGRPPTDHVPLHGGPATAERRRAAPDAAAPAGFARDRKRSEGEGLVNHSVANARIEGLIEIRTLLRMADQIVGEQIKAAEAGAMPPDRSIRERRRLVSAELAGTAGA
jgi:hypothetical protein